MRCAAALLLCCALLGAEDFVHLKNGRILRGRVVEETAGAVVLELGAGRIRVPRERIRLVERAATRAAPRRVVTERDEWFLVLHRGKVVGWRRVVQIRHTGRVQVEERTVFFRPGGGTDVDIRRVETADAAGKPLEFLLMESYGTTTEVTSGQVERGKVRVAVLRDGEARNLELKLPERWVLALPAWSRFLEEAKPGDARTITALDLRRLVPVELVLRREPKDARAPGEDDPRPWRASSLAGKVTRARALYRPGEGSLRVELNGSTLVARRTTAARVELARQAHKARRPISIEEAQLFPFYRRPKELTAYQPQAGLRIDAPDAGWMPRPREASRGLVLSFEKIALFASLEAFVYPLRDGADVDICLERALTRLKLTADELRIEGEAERHTIAGLPARTLRIRARHRSEDLRCLVTVVAADRRYVVLVGAAPERWWRWAEKDFRAFADSLVVVP